MDGWDENWVDTTSSSIRSIMAARLDLAVSKGCDGVDPDNIDAYSEDNNTGTGVTVAKGIDYIRFLGEEGHKRGLAVGLKNGLAIVEDVLEYVDFEVNEECQDWDECEDLQPFIEAGKPVFAIEYRENVASLSAAQKRVICEKEGTEGFSILIKTLALDSTGYACPV